MAGLELLVRALVALDEAERARTTLIELQGRVADVGTDPLRASALAAEGAVAACEDDPETARLCLEDAIDLYHRSGAPFETARARLELAQVLTVLGRHEAAAQQSREAHKVMSGMRAEPRDETGPPIALTPREVEVLRLVAQGLSNPAIAQRLVLSEHTVHRHLANILGKLDLPTRAAAAAWGARHGLV